MKWLAGLVFILLAISAGLFYKTQVATEMSSALTQADFGGVSLMLEYATTTESREKGLGGRKSIPQDYGMLFVFEKAGRYGFWMKDTLIPLDIFWLDDQGQVIYMAMNVATSSYPHVFYPAQPARYVLETAAGFARLHTIATGTPLLLQKFPTVTE